MDDHAIDPKAEPLRLICRAWQRRINRALEFRKKEFDTWADEGMRFYTGDTDVWDKCLLKGRGRTVDSDGDYAPSPMFRFVPAKVAELVQIYGPTLYHRNPVRTVTPRRIEPLDRNLYVDPAIGLQLQRLQQQMPQQQPGMPPQPVDPNLQMQLQQLQAAQQQAEQRYQELEMQRQQRQLIAKTRAQLISQVLNYTPNEFDLKSNSRRTINEALIKGMGVLWLEGRKLATGKYLYSTFYDTVDNFVVDPDAETWEDVKWVARRCVHWIYDVAADYKIPVEELRKKANFQSVLAQGESEQGDREDRAKDMVVYWKIWSKCGVGDRLPGMPEEYVDTLKDFGQNVYLVVGGDKFSEPFNFRAKDLRLMRKTKRKPKSEEEAEKMAAKSDEIFAKLQWPIPLHLDESWPVTPVYYHEVPNSIWPMAHIRTSLPYLKFMMWQLSFVADKARQTAREIVGLKAGLDDDIKDQIRGNDPITILELKSSQGEKLSELLEVFNHPQGGSTELMTVAAQVAGEFDKASGLTELAYAMPGGMRSAKEAEIKSAARNIRPDEMAQKTEDAMTLVARKEALASIWLLDGADVAPIVGDEGARLWDELIASQDPLEVAQELEFRIEAGSAKKPNKDAEIANMNMAVQSLGGVLTKLVDQGRPQPFNALMTDWAKVNDIQDVERYLVPPPPPPQPPPQPPVDPNIQLKAQAEMQRVQVETQARVQEASLKQQELQMRIAGKQQDLAMDAAKMQQDLEYQRMKQAMELQQIQQRQVVQAQVPVQGVV